MKTADQQRVDALSEFWRKGAEAPDSVVYVTVYYPIAKQVPNLKVAAPEIDSLEMVRYQDAGMQYVVYGIPASHLTKPFNLQGYGLYEGYGRKCGGYYLHIAESGIEELEMYNPTVEEVELAMRVLGKAPDHYGSFLENKKVYAYWLYPTGTDMAELELEMFKAMGIWYTSKEEAVEYRNVDIVDYLEGAVYA